MKIIIICFFKVLRLVFLRIISNNQFDIIKDYSDRGNNILEVKDPNNIGSNKLISSVIANNSLVSFKEIIPSMNDIFIQLVEGNKNL